MKKVLVALTAALAIGVAATAASSPVEARCYGCAVGAGVAAGIIGGAIVGGAIAGSRPAYAGYGYAPGYVAYPAYSAPYPVACPGGYWARRPLMDQWGNVVGYSRPRFFCP